MDKVYLEGERQANLEVNLELIHCWTWIRSSRPKALLRSEQVDGGIMDQMTVVGLATDCGKIVPKDLWAHRLSCASSLPLKGP